MILKTEPNWLARQPANHDSSSVWSIGPELHWTEVKPLEPMFQPVNQTNQSVPSESADSVKFNFFLTTSKQRHSDVSSIKTKSFWRIYNENHKIIVTNCKPSFLPPQQLPACHFARSWQVAAHDTQTALADGRYKPTTLFVIVFSKLPVTALEADVGNLPVAGNHPF